MENPDKTIDKKYADSDLYAVLQYVSNDRKTDERMTATKKRFGKTGGNVAYHGCEATPEEAHKIGLETARHIWGNDHEIVGTTHLNTDNIRNHFVIILYPFRPAESLKTISPTPYVRNMERAFSKTQSFTAGAKKNIGGNKTAGCHIGRF